MDKEKGGYKEGDFWISYGELANALEGADLPSSAKGRIENFVKQIKAVSFERENALVQSVQREEMLQTEVDRLETRNRELEKDLKDCEEDLEESPDLGKIKNGVEELLNEVFRRVVGFPISDLTVAQQAEMERLYNTFIPKPKE